MANTKFLDIIQKIGELEGKVDQMDIQIRSRFASLEKRTVEMHDSIKKALERQTERIDDLEKTTADIRGKASGIAFIVSTITAGVIALISYFKSH